MNLVTDKWISVIGIDGKPDYASLMEVFTAGEKYADLSVRPHERVALMRLLICIAQAALDGPKDRTEWREAPERLSKAVKAYLEEWQGSFNLFDPQKPFLQIAGLELIPKKKKERKKKSENDEADEEPGLTPLSKMDFALATGDKSTLFDHMAVNETERKYVLESIPVMLLTFLNFFPRGLMSASQWNNVVDEGRTKRGKPMKGKTSGKDAPCVPNAMYHTFLRGGTLKETIHLNLLSKVDVFRHYNQKNWGRPVWENPPRNPSDREAIKNATETYLGRLVPQSRWIKIDWTRKGIIWSAGKYVFLNFENGFPSEPSATVILNKNKRAVLGAKPDRAIWRELSALVIRRNQDGVGGALTLRNTPENETFDIQVCALMPKPRQQDIQDYMESIFSISDILLTQDGRATYEKEVQFADRLSGKLGDAIESYRKNIDGCWEQRLKVDRSAKYQLHSMATRHYWTAVEKSRRFLMTHISSLGTVQAEPTQKIWRSEVHKAAREAYITACGQETPRQIRAFALGWKKLFEQQKSEDVEEQENGGEA